ncbi:MAG: hypothetical protein ACYSR5_06775 [Planctomycetota bacterium]|jgi:prepilin-type processing-associated H-X9-DG protein
MNNMDENAENKVETRISRLSIISFTIALVALLVLLGLSRFLAVRFSVLYRILERYMVLILSLTSVLIAIFSIVKIKASRSRLKGKSIAIAAVVLSLVASHQVLMLPRIRSMPYPILCGMNLAGLGKAILIYSNDNNGKFPSASSWCDLLLEHTTTEENFMCGDSFLPAFSYGFNKNLDGLDSNDVPPDMVVLFEIGGGRNISGGPELMIIDKHNGAASNVLFGDFHVDFVRKEHAKNLKWEFDNKEGTN